MRLSWDDLLIIAAATQRPRELARLVAGAVVGDHEFDVQLHRDGRSYIILLRVVAGERIVTETEWAVEWSEIDEATRFGVLRIYIGQVLLGHERWRGRMNRRLGSLGIAPIPSPVERVQTLGVVAIDERQSETCRHLRPRLDP